MKQLMLKTWRKAALCALFAIMLLAATFVLTGKRTTSAGAEEPFVPDVIVKSQEDLKNALDDPQWADFNHCKIQLGNDIELTSSVTVYSDSDVEIDLNGYTLSRKGAYILNNYGILSVIDTSENKTGLIKSEKDGYGYTFYNCGDLTLNVNVTYGAEKGGQQGYIVDNEIALDNPQNIVRPKLTINGGTYTTGRSMFYTYDGDVTINDGKFIMRGEGTTAGQVIGIATMYKGLFEDVDPDPVDPAPYDGYHKVAVQINGGDFTELEEHQQIIKYELNSNIKPDPVQLKDFTVAISGGTYCCEVGAFLADGKWAPKNDKGYYVVEDEKPEEAKAVINVEEGVGLSARTIYFDDFGRAFYVSKSLVNPNDRTLKMLDNYQLNGAFTCARGSYGNFSANDFNLSNSINLTVDLNGKQLTVSNMDSHIQYSNGGKIELVMDSSAEGGKLVLNYPEGGTFQSTSRTPGISLGNTTNQYTMTFKNLTIERTGYLPETYYGLEGVNRDMALLRFGVTAALTEDYKMTFINCNIVSSLEFSVAADEKGDTGVLPPTTGGFAAFCYGSSKFDLDITSAGNFANKQKVLKFEFEEGKEYIYSWDITYFLPEGFVCVPNGDGNYKVIKAEKPYLVNADGFDTLKAALGAAGKDGTISIVQDVTERELVKIDTPVRILMRENNQTTITFESGLEISANAQFINGNINGEVKVTAGSPSFTNITMGNVAGTAFAMTGGTATFDNVKIDAQTAFDVSGGRLEIFEGEYKGAISGSADSLFILGGSFSADPEEYLYPGFGSTYSTMYDVSVTPSKAAQAWYSKLADNKITVSNEMEWLYLAAYVNSGEEFKNIVITLENDLDFGQAAKVSADGKVYPYYIPIGSVKHPFSGTLDGNHKTIRNITSGEANTGLFGCAGGHEFKTAIRNLTLEDCTFTSGTGFLFESNSTNGKVGYIVGGGIVAEARSLDLEGITLTRVHVGLGDLKGGSMFFGGMIGHSWYTLNVRDSNVSDVTVDNYWKSGGILGFTEGSFSVSNSSVSGVTFVGDPMFPEGVIAGNVTGRTITLENVTATAPDEKLIGAGQYYDPDYTELEIKGENTNIDVDSFGGSLTPTIKPSGDNFSIESNATLDREWFDFSELDGGFNVREEDGKYFYETLSYRVAIWRDGGQLQGEGEGEFDDIQAALEKVLEGDELHLYGNIAATITFDKEFDITIVLNNYGINGEAVEIKCTGKGKLTLSNSGENILIAGTVTIGEGVILGGTVENSGTLTANGGTFGDIAGEGIVNITGGTFGSVAGSEVTIEGGTFSGTVTGAKDIKGGTFTSTEILEDIAAFAENIAVEYVGIISGDGLVVKDKTALADDEKIVAGSSKSAFDESKISEGYCYVEEDGTYYIREISVYSEQELVRLANHKQELLENYLYSDAAQAKIQSIYDTTAKELEEQASGLTMAAVRKLVNNAITEMNAVPVLSVEQEENERALEQARKDAVIELKLYAVSRGVALDDESVTKGIEEIEKATAETVASVLESAKTAVNDVAVKAEQEAEQKAKEEAERVALEQAKKDAVSELKIYAASRGVALDDESVTKGIEEIKKATAETVASVLESAKTAVNAVAVKAEQEAEQKAKEEAERVALEQARKDAVSELKIYAASRGVSLEDKSVTDGLAAINSAADEQKVTSALATAKANVDKVKKAADDSAKAEADKQSAAAALEQAKKDAVSELKIYAASRGVALDDESVTKGIEDIEKATAETVASVLASAKTAVNAVATQAEQQAEQQAQTEAERVALEQARKDAVSELKIYAASRGVALDDASVTKGIEDIEKATAETVASVLASAKTAVNAVATQAEQQAEQQAQTEAEKSALEQAKTAAKNELRLYAVSKGVSVDDESVKEGFKEINAAASQSEIDTKLEAAKQNVLAAQAPEEDGGKLVVSVLVIVILVETVVVAGILLALVIPKRKKKNS